MYNRIKKVSEEYYNEKLLKYGDSPQGVNWSTSASQELRFKLISEIDNLNGKRIHDVGCGLAHFAEYLEKKEIRCHYVGSDISSLMIENARLKMPEIDLHIADILDTEKQWMRADYLTASGLFYVRSSIGKSDWWDFIRDMLSRMFELSSRGISFNMLSSYVDYEDDHLFYQSPSATMDFCVKNLNRRITIRHDYPLWEYTVYVYKK